MTADMLLERLDLALADDPSADADLLALVHDVRAEAPQMTAGFAATLDDRVRAGFAPAPGATRRGRRRRRRRMPNLFVMGPIAAVAAAGVVAIVIGTGGGSSPTPVLPVQGSAGAEHTPGISAAKSPADSAAAAPGATAATPIAPQSLSAPLTSASGGTTGARKVERSTQLSLVTPTDTLQKVAGGVVRVTEQADGFVGNSQVQISGDHGSASFTLRIPGRNLENALTALTHLAHVTSMNQSTQDITGEFATTNTSLARLTARLAALRRTKQTAATIALEQRLSRALAAQQAALSDLRHRADYVTVAVAITARHHHVAPAHHDGGSFTPGGALHTAGRIISVGAGVLLIAATILIPLALLLAALWFASRGARRRHREAALKAS